jgi:pimeloyl-ACP methyl ester carboxylesterase
VIAGNSLGGALALRAGERDDLPLRALMPIAPAGLDMPGWFAIIERDPFVRFALRSPLPMPQRVLRGVVGEAYRQLAFARPRAASRPVVNAFTGHFRERAAVARYLDNGRRMLPELHDPFHLERVRAPLLLVWGDRDRMVPHRGSRKVLEALPDTSYELLRGVGHCPQVEAHERVVALLLQLLEQPRRKVA